MSIEAELKREGIEVIKTLDTFSVITIAKNVSTKLVLAFPEQNLDYNDLFIKLSRLNMYIAKMPNNIACAKYYYKNFSIYFSDKIDFSKIDAYAIHECIHYLQELRDEKNNLIHLGLCDFTSSKLPGMALNEAAVQLMSSKALNEKIDTVKYFDSHEDELQGESNSISNQKRILETYAKQNGFSNLQWYTDDGYSGANFQRPG